VLNFLSATNVRRRVPADEGMVSGMLGVELKDREGEQRVEAADPGAEGEPPLPTPTPGPTASAGEDEGHGLCYHLFPSFASHSRLYLFSLFIALVCTISTWNGPGRSAKGRQTATCRQRADSGQETGSP